VAVLGATGYAGRELIAILARHPRVRIASLMSSGRASRTGSDPFPISKSHPALQGMLQGHDALCKPLNLSELTVSSVDLVFLAIPHETSLDIVPPLLDRGLRVIDLSGAFRLKDRDAYPRWYGFEHDQSGALEEAVYGLPEVLGAAAHDAAAADLLRRARLVANPGCYATSIILALAPLLRSGWVDPTAGIICDSKSGASGAGRAPTDRLQFCEVNENCRAYGLFHHRHVPEMLQALGVESAEFVFTPHLLPVTRGILSTIYVRLASARSLPEVHALFSGFYEGARLVRVYTDGSVPEIHAVANTNFADLGFAFDAATRRLIIVSALDNLLKGAAGQAVQNMNLMYGFAPETALL
jgi:N-acetyl-gamma-glutamyl-phosphate reductase